MNLIPPEAIGNEEAAVKIINLYNYIAENSKQFSDKCLYRIGNIYKNLGKNGEAIKFYNKAIESSEDKNFTITLTLEIAELYKKEGEKKSSEEILQKVLSQSFDGLDYSLLARIAQSCGQLGKYEKEVEILRQLVEKSPKTEIAKNAQYRIACIYNFCLKNFIQAIEEYKKFINLYPNDWRITLCWKQIGGIHLELQEYEKALEVQKKLLEINPDDPSPKVMIKLINDYYKKGTIPTEKDIEKVLKEIKGERKK